MKKMILSAFFLALGLVMPFITGQIPEIGSMLLPMHIPVLICGFVCGWKYGGLVGFIVPLMRSVIWGMPPIMTAICMAFELAAYGIVTGFLYKNLPKNKVLLYVELIVAMIVGRVIWGAVSIFIYGIQGNVFSFEIFMGGALLNAIPGIILQIVLVPVLVMALQRLGVMNLND